MELRHGELFTVPPPKYIHFMIQQILRDLLDRAAAGAGRAYTEVGFRPTAEHEFRIADVAYASAPVGRVRRGRITSWVLQILVVEVLSPSNSAAEMIERERLCLENGCLEFWLVDPDQQLVRVSTPEGRAMTYHSGQEIPLPLLNSRIALDAIFAVTSENHEK